MDLVPFLWAAGVLQALVAAANLPAARLFRYREALRAVPAHVAEVFVIQNLFIMLTTLGMAGLCLAFADELAGGSTLGRALSGFLAAFWGTRLAVQLFFYDRELRRKYRAFDVLFVATFVYLVVTFAAAASVRGGGVARPQASRRACHPADDRRLHPSGGFPCNRTSSATPTSASGPVFSCNWPVGSWPGRVNHLPHSCSSWSAYRCSYGAA